MEGFPPDDMGEHSHQERQRQVAGRRRQATFLSSVRIWLLVMSFLFSLFLSFVPVVRDFEPLTEPPHRRKKTQFEFLEQFFSFWIINFFNVSAQDR